MQGDDVSGLLVLQVPAVPLQHASVIHITDLGCAEERLVNITDLEIHELGNITTFRHHNAPPLSHVKGCLSIRDLVFRSPF